MIRISTIIIIIIIIQATQFVTFPWWTRRAKYATIATWLLDKEINVFHVMLKYHDMETDITGTEESSVATWAEVLEIMTHIEIGAYNYFEVRDDQYRQIGYISIPCGI